MNAAAAQPVVAYLVNEYPKVSHSFIRREVRALEGLGVRVARFSIRPPSKDLPDAQDREDAGVTRVVLGVGAAGLASAMLKTKLAHPLRYWRAFRAAVAMGRRSEAGVVRHLIYLAEACVLVGWLREANAKHLHAHFGTNPAAVARLVHLLSGTPYSFTVHGPEEFDKPGALSLREKIEDAAFVVAISSFGRSQLYRWCSHEHWGKVHVVHCGVDEGFLRTEATGAPSIPSNTLVCVGRLCEQKGQLLLVEAAARVARTGRDFRLVLVGDGEMRGEVEALCRERGIERQVVVTGWASGEQVREHLAGCRAFVLPSFAEGLPVAIMEALALGRPVITTSIAGIPELVTPECGWLVPAGDVERLAEAMAAALDAPAETLRRMGEVGRQRVRERHDAEIEARKLAALFGVAGEAPHATRPTAAEVPA